MLYTNKFLLNLGLSTPFNLRILKVQIRALQCGTIIRTTYNKFKPALSRNAFAVLHFSKSRTTP